MTQTILVTGASGFIAAHVVESFLGAGFKVRGTVRSESTAKKVRAEHASHPAKSLELVIVPDISATGAFDEAVVGVDGVIHTASPFTFQVDNIEKDLLEPAVNGTLSVLKAVKAHNPAVKRIVITSSAAAVFDISKGARPGYNYTENDWNPDTAEAVIAANDPVRGYLLSKTLAEQAAWDFVKTEKPGFTIATLTPPMVYGPLASDFSSMDKLNTSSADMYRLFNGSLTEVPPTTFSAFADVRDLAQAHLLAYTEEQAANQRYVISGTRYIYQQVLDVIREKFPELRATTPDSGSYEFPDIWTLDASKSVKQLGMKYRTLEETVVDSVNSLLALKKKLGA